jgi:hypothetical protein
MQHSSKPFIHRILNITHNGILTIFPAFFSAQSQMCTSQHCSFLSIAFSSLQRNIEKIGTMLSTMPFQRRNLSATDFHTKEIAEMNKNTVPDMEGRIGCYAGIMSE